MLEGRGRDPGGGVAVEKGGRSRAAIIEDAGGERRETVRPAGSLQ